ncbi:hypothetical protein WJX73_000376 [Symbiochloris irregularis]|uniref:Aminopeptidase N n=1 Tax=Symbiochloris irregularis TaxID=706552 RepID=A0AAW1NLI2_9CHLO
MQFTAVNVAKRVSRSTWIPFALARPWALNGTQSTSRAFATTTGARYSRLSDVRRRPYLCVPARSSTSVIQAPQEEKSGVSEQEGDKGALNSMAKPQPVYRKDYKPTPYLIDQVHLTFQLGEEHTTVLSDLHFKPNYQGDSPPEVVLNGRKDLKLQSVKVDGKDVPQEQYEVSEKLLMIRGLPKGPFNLQIETQIKPQDNTSLEGLYKSSGNFCTQCEAEGFRGITYFYDRPDVLAKYTTRIEAPKGPYPVLLSNGNLQASGELSDGRHFATWEDPFPKPCYLFALVAGDLAVSKDSFTTASGRRVDLHIYVQQQNIDRVAYAMQSLKAAMKWDEDVFGLEYDLDLFNIVAVDDFNMGAMENKSLNIFNSRLVLASPATATDDDFARIEGVVAHEYFHNWTGNRVTCRDWFQLTLKEGLTVFRDQEFSADMRSRGVKRVDDASALRRAQFPEDAGAFAHPIRPEEYTRMDNFYSLTVYEKGAEVVRLYQTLLGQAGFRKGMDLYFKRHDGTAVTCDDFRAAMADANDVDLSALGTWYQQAGTPAVKVSTSYNASARTYTVKASQSTPATPGQSHKDPVLIPLAVGLLGKSGQPLALHLQGSKANGSAGDSAVLRLEKASQEFVFTEVPEEPVPSLCRNFSAPIKLEVEGQTEDDLIFLVKHDTDPFARWDAAQRLGQALMIQLYAAAADTSKNGSSSLAERCSAAGGVKQSLVDAFRAVLQDKALDGAMAAALLTLPGPTELQAMIHHADPVTLHEVRKYVVKELAQQLRPDLEAAVKRNDLPASEEYSPDAAQAAKRVLKNKCLGFLAALGEPAVYSMLLQRFRDASNMTDEIAALAALTECPCKERETGLSEFYQKWKDENLVVLKWLALQAASNVSGNLAAVQELQQHPAFNIKNPNNCYSLFLPFVRSPVNFHAGDGSGYRFLADSILTVDKINSQVAARMASPFTQLKQFDSERQTIMKQQAQRVADTEGLSENVFEVVQKSLKD